MRLHIDRNNVLRTGASLRPSQQYFSDVETFHVLIQYQEEDFKYVNSYAWEQVILFISRFTIFP